jgi:AraC-like DNA-binding protein
MNRRGEWSTQPYDLLIYLCSGGFSMEREGESTIHVKESELLFLPAHSMRRSTFHAKGGASCIINLGFGATCHGSLDLLSLYSIPALHRGEAAARAGELISSMSGAYEDEETPATLREIRVQRMGFELLEILLAESCPKQERLDLLQRHHRLTRLLQSIREAPEAPRNVAAMAKELNLSKPRVHQLFRSLTGLAPMAYVRTQRLERAASILRVEQVGVGEAARRVGYGDQFTFSKAFKRHFGISPLQSRRREEMPT